MCVSYCLHNSMYSLLQVLQGVSHNLLLYQQYLSFEEVVVVIPYIYPIGVLKSPQSLRFQISDFKFERTPIYDGIRNKYVRPAGCKKIPASENSAFFFHPRYILIIRRILRTSQALLKNKVIVSRVYCILYTASVLESLSLLNILYSFSGCKTSTCSFMYSFSCLACGI